MTAGCRFHLTCLSECDEFSAAVLFLFALEFVHLVSAVGTLEGEHLTMSQLWSPLGMLMRTVESVKITSL